MAETVPTALTLSELGRKRTRELPETGTVQITFRLDVNIVRQIDDEAKRIAKEHFGATIGRTEIIRALIIESLSRRAKRRQ